MNIDSLRVVVTGAASGMGRVFVRELARGGAHVAAFDIDDAGLARLRDELVHDGVPPSRLVGLRCDVSDEGDVERAFDEAWGQLGYLNALINNAGIFRDQLLVKKDRETGEVRTMSLQAWQKVIDIDLTGPFLCTRALASRMVRDDIHPGVVVNMSSAARHGNVGQSNYSAAKAGLVADTRLWGNELARYGIRVGAIAPGFIETPILTGMRPDVLEGMLRTVPLRRVGKPEEIWQGVRFIVECDYFTGRCIDIDGGVSL